MKITFEGETLTELIQQMQVFLVETGNWWNATSGADAPAAEPEAENPVSTEEEPAKRKPGRPRKTVAEDPAPVPEEKPAQTVEEKHPLDFDAIRSTAITKLMTVYNMGGAHSVKVKGVLKEFGVTKFAEVPEEKLKELLSRAVELESEAA